MRPWAILGSGDVARKSAPDSRGLDPTGVVHNGWVAIEAGRAWQLGRQDKAVGAAELFEAIQTAGPGNARRA